MEISIKTILELGLTSHASDIHVIPGMPPLLRIDGELIQSKNFPVLTDQQTQEILLSTMNQDQKNEFEHDLVIDMGLYYPDLGNFRLNVFHQINGIAGIIRIVPAVVPTFDQLQLPPSLKKLLMLPYGLVLVTGPTGSGKSTTLASMIDYINTNRGGHVITIEDPIEYIHKNKRASITQLEVGRDAKSFSAALRSSLRQDPNVIMLGEMRDLETIRLALMAAETGHLVLSTLHASSAAVTINRIIDIFPRSERDRIRNMLSECIQGIICQILVKSAKVGRVAAFEVMFATPAIRHLIAQGRSSHIESTIQTSGDLGMFTLETYMKTLVSKGEVSQTLARAVLGNRDSMKFSDKK